MPHLANRTSQSQRAAQTRPTHAKRRENLCDGHPAQLLELVLERLRDDALLVAEVAHPREVEALDVEKIAFEAVARFAARHLRRGQYQ